MPALILASASPIRRAMLDQAGLRPAIEPATIDEAGYKGGDDPATVAGALAAAKAIDVSRSHPGGWVIGSDSVVTVDGRLFSKPRDKADAAAHLRYFSGKRMILTSAVALARDGAVEWIHVDDAKLHWRKLGDPFIANYLDAEWPAVAYCVGVFRMEGRGVQLFDAIEGDYFTILGMPLIPLLRALRERAVIES